MKKRNVIFLVIDSLSYKTLQSYPFPDELFLNNYIKKHSIVYDNVYTQGPYTEASMNGLAYGQRGLDGSAFMFSHAKFSHSFVDNLHADYLTFCSGMSCRLFVDHSKKSFDKYHYHFYTPTTLPTLQWNRVDHFCKLYQSRKLTKDEKGCLVKLIRYSLDDTESFLNSLKSKEYETSLSNNYVRLSDVDLLLKKVQIAKKNFTNNQDSFLDFVLRKEIDFSKFDFNYYVPYNDINDQKMIFDKYRPLLIKEAKKHYSFRLKSILNFNSNLFHSFLNTKSFTKNLVKVLLSSSRKRKNLESVYSALLKPDSNKKRAISFDRCITEIKKLIEDNDNEKKPFFIYCQPDDFHPTSVFWTYDSPDDANLESELSSALSLAKRIKLKNCNIFDYLSIKYIDSKINELFNILQKNNKLDDTDVIITADHGSWSFNDYVRMDDNLIMSEERMHIPCLFFRNGQPELHDTNLHNSYSIPNTILSFVGYPPDNYFYGKPFEIDSNKYLLSENLGFGCPDIFNVPINYVVHNQRYKLNIKVGIEETITEKNCVGFYDLVKDPLEEINIISKIKKINKTLFLEMFNVAANRHSELQSNTSKEDFYDFRF